MQLRKDVHHGNPQGTRETNSRKYTLALSLAILVLGIGLMIEADALHNPPSIGVRGAHAQSTPNALESLGVPLSGMGIRSTNMWTDGNLLYGEALDPDTEANKNPFFADDVTMQKAVHIDTAHEDIHLHQRNIMVDSEGNAYFSVNTNVNGISIPDGFSDSMVFTGLSSPTSMTFTPSGSTLIISEQSGTLMTYDLATDTLSTLLALPGEAPFGVVLDPNFQTNNYFYVYYNSSATGRFRVSRYEFTSSIPTLAADPNSEVVILDIQGSSWRTHSGGSMNFGPDGYLYVTTGDGQGHDNFDSPDPQSLGSLLGKVLRLDPGLCSSTCPGVVYPSSNPTVESPIDDPNTRGEIWAWGFRNPFSSDFDEATGEYYVIDVGVNRSSTPDATKRYEEINFVVAGGNYGWNACHGICNDPPNHDVGSIDLSKFVDPIYTYDHTDDGRSIVGAAVYRGSQFPSDFSGNLIYADFIGGYLARLKTDFTEERFVSGLGPESVLDLRVGPVDGSIYYLQYDTGTVRRIDFAPPSSINLSPLSLDFGRAKSGGSRTTTSRSDSYRESTCR